MNVYNMINFKIIMPALLDERKRTKKYLSTCFGVAVTENCRKYKSIIVMADQVITPLGVVTRFLC